MEFNPIKNIHTATIVEVKPGEEPSYYAACNNCDEGAIPMWFEPEQMLAQGSCIMCANVVKIKLIPPGHIIKMTPDGGESIVPKK